VCDEQSLRKVGYSGFAKTGRPMKARVRGVCVSAREKICRKSGRMYRPLFVRASQASGSGSSAEGEVLRMEERKGIRSS
jgi:hypothetical protein